MSESMLKVISQHYTKIPTKHNTCTRRLAAANVSMSKCHGHAIFYAFGDFSNTLAATKLRTNGRIHVGIRICFILPPPFRTVSMFGIYYVLQNSWESGNGNAVTNGLNDTYPQVIV